MAPIAVILKFLISIGAVIDEDIGAVDEPENIAVGLARHVFSIGYVADRAALVLDTVAGGTVGMVEGHSQQPDARCRLQNFASAKITEIEMRTHGVHRHREKRVHHKIGQHFADAALWHQVPSPDAQFVSRIEGRREEGNATDVVEMGVAEEEIGGKTAPNAALARKIGAERMDSRAGIEDQHALTTADLQARRITAVAGRTRTRAGDATPHTPEANKKVVRVGQVSFQPGPATPNILARHPLQRIDDT